MKEAVIVATARTPIGKAYRGGFNNLGGAIQTVADAHGGTVSAGNRPEGGARVEVHIPVEPRTSSGT